MKIALAGGGTAGHAHPAASVGKELRDRHGFKAFYIGRKGSIEERIAKAAGIRFLTANSKGFNKKELLAFALQNAAGVAEALAAFRKEKPDYLFAAGGYASAPAVAAAKILGIPYAIHEQNRAEGKVNRLFAKGAKTVFSSFPVQETKKSVRSGNPVRYNEALSENGEQILFLGGSGGSERINEFAAAFAKAHPSIGMILQTGEKRHAKAAAGNPPPNLRLVAYAEDMMALYKEAKIAVCRAGSGTLFELANLGVPAIAVPLPSSAEDHQKKNALYFAEKGAAIAVEEGEGFQERLEKAALSLWEDEKAREAMKANMGKLAARNAAEAIAKRILSDLSGN